MDKCFSGNDDSQIVQQQLEFPSTSLTGAEWAALRAAESRAA